MTKLEALNLKAVDQVLYACAHKLLFPACVITVTFTF